MWSLRLCSLRVCVGSLRVIRLPPIVQRLASRVGSTGHTKLPIGVNVNLSVCLCCIFSVFLSGLMLFSILKNSYVIGCPLPTNIVHLGGSDDEPNLSVILSMFLSTSTNTLLQFVCTH